MKCYVCNDEVHHYNSVYFPDRMNEAENYPCFILCFACVDALSTYFHRRTPFRHREITGRFNVS